ncbi:uncharacterized protein LOC118699073 isoform X1 [Molothrus ater]|uniref:uncharacterized protein LOC118699073 isoform X1 n=1 Tax=Molothrus ater TaxID=84834 RepID=UPI00174C0891|nr:uncharacterized protein LOC118699073 isoform X1 [Molothrus ater]XP_054373942.1 uncharacterized protein LOC118699073 isoform X1 [Molothrus ater]XP_054373943.1 uncharacterized protein LOC118699073 isoform X1 [Molothrus ater]XP_054373944.1 uncharacterized protein LOC118699073 isoform X1 [Molothrus ater]
MHEPPAAGAGTESGLASSVAASAAPVRGIRPPPLPFSSSAAQTALKSRGRARGLSPGTSAGTKFIFTFPEPPSVQCLGRPDSASGRGEKAGRRREDIQFLRGIGPAQGPRLPVPLPRAPHPSSSPAAGEQRHLPVPVRGQDPRRERILQSVSSAVLLTPCCPTDTPLILYRTCPSSAVPLIPLVAVYGLCSRKNFKIVIKKF